MNAGRPERRGRFVFGRTAVAVGDVSRAQHCGSIPRDIFDLTAE